MKINLKHRYRGILTDEKWLEAGIQDIDTDLTKYLVDNGHADYIESPIVASETPIPAIADLSRNDIKALLDAQGIEYSQRAPKADLIGLLEGDN